MMAVAILGGRMKCELLVVRPRPSKYTKDQRVTDMSMTSRRWIPERHVGLRLDKSVTMASKDDQCARGTCLFTVSSQPAVVWPFWGGEGGGG